MLRNLMQEKCFRKWGGVRGLRPAIIKRVIKMEVKNEGEKGCRGEGVRLPGASGCCRVGVVK
jgi:hypothetical protein